MSHPSDAVEQGQVTWVADRPPDAEVADGSGGWRARWPEWIGYVAAAFSLVYGALGLFWALGGSGFPFGTGDPELMAEPDFAFKVSLLAKTTPEVAGPVIAVLGLTGAVAGTLMARRWGARGPAPSAQWLLPTFGGVLAFGLTVVIQDFRPLIVVAYAPVLAIGKLFGGFAEADWSDLFLVPRLNLLVLLLAGVAWALTAVAYRRAVTGACVSCGRRDHLDSHLLQRLGRPATWVAFSVPLVYCLTRWAWALGFSLGIDPAFYQEGKEDGLWLAGAGLATFGLFGAILTLGLIQRWGEVFPRWMIGLAGKRVPPMLAVVPASLVAVLVTAAGFMYIRIVISRGVTAASWPMELPETLWVVWGAALFTAAMAYHQRRRAACDRCLEGSAEIS
ncbi:hypothetical protein [Ornithinimicrobium faecis]|uniref:hypothetical protein n=1 Tax=Ornithinimicrobium faecis TaxID=2934158 RepID=UPI00211734C0|nr:hypothetical protein [Ornithinimicrobium sp. HY1745]